MATTETAATAVHCRRGCVEELSTARSRRGYQAPSQVIRYGEGGMTPNVALPCGGWTC